MAQHICTVDIPRSVYDRVNRLLAFGTPFEEMTDEEMRAAGVHDHYCEGIFAANFDDGSRLNFDLCSGSSNYFDDAVWTSADGRTDVTLECAFELSDIEVETDGEVYVVNLNITD